MNDKEAVGYNEMEDELIYPEEGEQEAVKAGGEADEDDCD